MQIRGQNDLPSWASFEKRALATLIDSLIVLLGLGLTLAVLSPSTFTAFCNSNSFPRLMFFGLATLATATEWLPLLVFSLLYAAFAGWGGSTIHWSEYFKLLLSIDGVFYFIAPFIVSWLYNSLMESSRHQATLGKQTLGLKVTSTRGHRISFLRASLRHFGKIASTLSGLLGYLMLFFTGKRQSLHDKIAGCLVIDSSPKKPVRYAPANGIRTGVEAEKAPVEASSSIQAFFLLLAPLVVAVKLSTIPDLLLYQIRWIHIAGYFYLALVASIICWRSRAVSLKAIASLAILASIPLVPGNALWYKYSTAGLIERRDAAAQAGNSSLVEKYNNELGSDNRSVRKSPRKASTYFALGNSLKRQNKLTEAKDAFLQGLAIHDTSGDKLDFHLLQPVKRLAEIYKMEGDLAHAEVYYLRALRIKSQFRGQDDPRLVGPLAEVYQLQGKYTEAEAMYKRVVKRYEQSGNHSLEIAARNKLADVQRKLNRNQEGQQLDFATSIKEDLYKRWDLANRLRNEGRIDQSESLYRHLIEECARGDSTIRPYKRDIEFDYARLLKMTNRDEESARLVVGGYNKGLISSYLHCASLYGGASAEYWYKNALALYDNGTMKPDNGLVKTLEEYATHLRQCNRVQEAASLESRARKVRAELNS